MPTISPRLSLFVPNDDTLFVTEDIAANWESIDDTVVGFLTDVAASRPAASSENEGFLFYATDTEVISFSNGTDWVPTTVVAPVAHSAVVIDENYDFPDNYNGLSLSPTTIGDGIEVNVAAGSEWQISPWEALTTDSVDEGSTNLYYTDARAEAAADGRIAAATTDDLAEGSTNLYYTNGRVDAQTATNRAPLYFVENIVTANYTLALADVAKVVAFNSSSNLTLTVPTNASVAFPIGTVINIYRAGTGEVDIVGEAGVTVRNEGSISEQFGEMSLRKRDTNEWVLV